MEGIIAIVVLVMLSVLLIFFGEKNQHKSDKNKHA